jgi:hypothetical protein
MALALAACGPAPSGDSASGDAVAQAEAARERLAASEGGRRGAFKNEAWADSVSFRHPFDEGRLVAPEGARVAPPPGG